VEQDLVFREGVFHPDESDGDPADAALPRSVIDPGLPGATVAGIVAALVAGGVRESFVLAPSGLWKRAALLDQMGGWGR